MRLIAFIGVSLVCMAARAELPAGSNVIKPFDDSVFDLPSMKAQEKPAKVGDRTSSGDDGSYKRPEWVAACEGLKQTRGMEAFRNCFAEKRAASDREWDPLESTCRHASLSIL